jgi:hypothetical protein
MFGLSCLVESWNKIQGAKLQCSASSFQSASVGIHTKRRCPPFFFFLKDEMKFHKNGYFFTAHILVLFIADVVSQYVQAILPPERFLTVSSMILQKGKTCCWFLFYALLFYKLC